MNWNRQYRPKQIKDLHLAKVRDHFLALLKSGKFPQVFLFAGPKGTGKTSTARIVAALLNDPANAEAVQTIFFEKKANTKPLQEPTVDDERVNRIFAGSSFMVQELDAASNRGIDDVRSLKERISLPPQDGLISVYILDEVHMLTTEAFNALLKLLEEPPPHVVFILATTEQDKIPATVVSRAQSIGFTKASVAELVTALKGILKAEKLEFEEPVLELVAQRADGSFRDAVKLLEMIAQVGPVTAATAEQVLSVSTQEYLPKLLEALLAKDSAKVVGLFNELRSHSSDQKLIYTQLFNLVHTDLLKAHGVVAGTALWPAKTSQFLLKELSDPFVNTPTPIPLFQLDLKFLEIIDRAQKRSGADGSSSDSGSSTKKTPTSHTTTASPSERAPSPRKATDSIHSVDSEHDSLLDSYAGLKTVVPAVTFVPQTAMPEVVSTSMSTSKVTETAVSQREPGDGNAICEKWVDIVSAAVKQNFGLATLLRSARPLSGELGKVTVSVFYSFHKEQLLQPKFKQQLDILFADFAGGRIELECILADQPVAAELHEVKKEDNLAELAVASLM